MNKNVGSADKIIRYVVGLSLVSMAFWAPGPLKWLAVIGVVLILTAAFSFCGLYTLLGISTCPRQEKLTAPN